MNEWKSQWFDGRDRGGVVNRIVSYLNNELKEVHPIYTKIGIGQGDDSPVTAVLLYKDEKNLPADFPTSVQVPAWNSYLSGSVDDILSHLNTVDVNEAVLAQFALTKTGGDNFTAFLFTPQGA